MWGHLLLLFWVALARHHRPEIIIQRLPILTLEYPHLPVGIGKGPQKLIGLAVHQGVISTINIGPDLQEYNSPGRRLSLHLIERPARLTMHWHPIIHSHNLILTPHLRNHIIVSLGIELRAREERFVVLARKQVDLGQEGGQFGGQHRFIEGDL